VISIWFAAALVMTQSETARTAPPARLPPWSAAVAVAIVALAFRVWRLEQNDFGHAYYAAAARSMSGDWSNFFFNAFDPAGFISVDKPPVAFWIEALSVRLFGFNTWALLLPQALMGTAAAVALCEIVRRSSGNLAGLIAGLGLAISPINVAVDRLNFPDSALVLIMVLAAGALARSLESPRVGWLLVSLTLVGIGFNAKMLAAFVVLPTFYAAYLLLAPVSWRARMVRLALGSLVLAIVSSLWIVAVDLTPQQKRPFVGGSRNNTARDLALGYNGVERLTGGDRALLGPLAAPGGTMSTMGGQLAFNTRPGWARLADRGLATQAMWLFPFALVAGLAALVVRRSRSEIGAALLWLGWFVTHAVVFSFSRGIMHPYYFVMLAPPLAALTGIGGGVFLESARRRHWSRLLFLAGVWLTAAWQVYLLEDYLPWKKWLVPVTCGAATAATIGLVLLWPSSAENENWKRIGRCLMPVSLAALFVCPGAWAMTAVLGRLNHAMPAVHPLMMTHADEAKRAPMRLGGRISHRPEVAAGESDKLVAFLRANRRGERFLVAVPSAVPASWLIVETGEAVMAAGGFPGSDPVLPPNRLASMVDNGEIRFVLNLPTPALTREGEWIGWVRTHATPVDRKYWMPDDARKSRWVNGELFDCKPGAGLVQPPSE
jgi:4-amino-4-deoxy-L-arabinose transferase-like glycosyltransferase